MSSLPAGRAQPLGAACIGDQVNFSVYSANAARVELCLFDVFTRRESASYDLRGSAQGLWHGMLARDLAPPGTLYAYRVHGEWDPAKGHRFDARHYLVDPCARRFCDGDPPLGMVVESLFDWQNDAPPATPWRDSLIYELHVKGFTQLHPQVPAEWRGKYLGLTAPAVIEHLRGLGVTAVELLPCQAFMSEAFLIERGLRNYWGYNPIAWFAPASEYSADDPVREFKAMVRELHNAQIEVILDVVFNHTAEGNDLGPTVSFKGIDNSVYYLLDPERGHYENLSGCGNTVNCKHPQVSALIVECLKYWVEEMHVDGFRFDLATILARTEAGFDEHARFFAAVRAEPALAYIKLIAEPWDVGAGGYQLGRFPAGWSEWNDRYRDTMRSFWRGDDGKIGEFAERFAGSSDIFRYKARRPSASVNFVTAHDGFTLNDLVSYEQRHNEANLSGNEDGSSNNLSRNYGIEGATAEPAIRALRLTQMKNLLVTLLLSQGVPMIQAGDEFARTQGGNNNAYCQDNEITWLNWQLNEDQTELCAFVASVCELRRKAPQFRRDTFLKGGTSRVSTKDVIWLTTHGVEMADADWNDRAVKVLGIRLACPREELAEYLVLINAAESGVDFQLPVTRINRAWIRRLDTSISKPPSSVQEPLEKGAYALSARSVAVLEA